MNGMKRRSKNILVCKRLNFLSSSKIYRSGVHIFEALPRIGPPLKGKEETIKTTVTTTTKSFDLQNLSLETGFYIVDRL